MPVLLLIRHGENDYVKTKRMAGRLPGVHLNEKGRRQAAAVAERLKTSPIKAIYTSPLERAVETAQPLADALGLAPIVRPGLLESNVGQWEGKSVKELSRLKVWRTVQQTPSLFSFPGGETFAEIQNRISQEISAIAASHEAKDLIACFSHADPIKLAVAYFVGLPLDMFQRLSVSPASISVLAFAETGVQLAALNLDSSFNLPVL